MKQYEFEVRNKRTGAVDQVRVTAPSRALAWANAVEEYTGHHVDPLPLAVRPAHAVAGEIDATNADYTQRVLDMARQAFGVPA